jgi:hypothetical protein
MLQPYPRFLAAASALAAAVTAFAIPPAAAATTSARAATPAVRHATAPANTTELLLNGDRVLRTGPTTYAVLRSKATGFAGAVTALHLGSHTLEIPAPAIPYLNHGLDPSLFDVTRLPRTGTLPVTVTYSGPKAPALPGITLTSTRPGIATGVLTATSAPVFTAALVRQFVHDHAIGSYGSDGLFANGTTIRLTGATPAAPVRHPGYRLYVLTAKGIALNGKPDTGDSIDVFNTDNFDYFSSPFESNNFFYHGTAKYSLPAGHYGSIALFTDVDSTGRPVDWRLVVNPAFTVKGDTTMTSDERKSSSAITATTPRPAVLDNTSWTLTFTDATKLTFTNIYDAGSGFPVYVNPVVSHPAAGSMRVTVLDRLESPISATSPYTYDLSFADRLNTITKQDYHANSGNLASVTARYSSDIKEIGGLFRYAVYSFDANGFFFLPIYQVVTPVRQTEYVSAAPKLAVDWLSSYIASAADNSGGQTDSGVSYLPGEKASDNWNTYPLHTSLNATVLGKNGIYPVQPSVTRSGDELSFLMWPFSDNTLGHTGTGYSPASTVAPPGGISGRYTLDANGKQIAAGNADQTPEGISAFVKNIKVAPASALYRLTLTADRAVSPYVLSTQTSTSWTWRSAHESGTLLPHGWICPDLTRKCASQSLMTTNYSVAHLGLDGVAPAGSQVLRISVGHQQAAPSSPTTGVTASVSADGGKTWQPAKVRGSGSTWYASFTAAAGSKVSLRIGATDKAGGAISETILNAYATSGSAASAGYVSPKCATAKVDHFSCFVLYDPHVATGAGPVGWGPKDIQKAYRLPVNRAGDTVAVVEFYDTPLLETYLNVYRKQYGLGACTTANGCFRKVNEYGKPSPLPPSGVGSGADLEATLDVDMISAACPKCHILVVEAKTATISDGAIAEDSAARLGAAIISNSYGARESGYSQSFSKWYDHPGHTIVASAGDYGWEAANFPANLKSVTAVGGTQLALAHNRRGYSESVWNTPGSGAGASGCSAYVAKPSWQHDTACPGRTVADVSALAWNVAIYEPAYAAGGWLPVGGTSVAAPIIAGVYALAGNATTVAPGSEYAHPSAFFDITTGNNDWWNQAHGKSCGYTYLCMAKPGYDAPTGLGTPNGITGF